MSENTTTSITNTSLPSENLVDDKPSKIAGEGSETGENHNGSIVTTKNPYEGGEATPVISDDGSDILGVEGFLSVQELGENDYIPPKKGMWPVNLEARFKKRLQKAPKRADQHRDYIALLEQRLAYIERRLNLCGFELRDDPETKDKIPVIPKLRRIKWKEFKALGRPYKKGKTEVYAIDVLVGEPVILPQWQIISSTIAGNPTSQVLDLENNTAGLKSDGDTLQTLSEPPLKKPSEQHVMHSPVPERIRINSKPLTSILSLIQGFDIEPSVVLFRPYRSILHHQDEIRQWLKSLENEWETPENSKPQESNLDAVIEPPLPPKREFSKNIDTNELNDLRCLVDFIDTDLTPRLDYLQKTSYQKILYSDIWHLFKPGNEVLGSLVPGTRQVYRIIQVTGIRHRSSYVNKPAFEGVPIILHCKYLDFNGKILGPVLKKIPIPIFDGEREIRSLPVYPLRFAEKSAEIRNELVERGKKFMQFTQVKHVQFVGTTLDSQEEVDSQVVVDFEQTLQHNPKLEPEIEALRTGDATIELVDEEDYACHIKGCCGSESRHSDHYIDKKRATDYNRDSGSELYSRHIDSTKSLRESELLLLNHRVFAFILRSRKWASIHIDNIRPVGRLKDSDGFDKLVLPRGHKQMVRSLVNQHFIETKSTEREEEQIDLVRGKGKGLIILLHGAPGVGKTSTAECVAESFNKPLFPITCGDLGITASDVETNLETNFMLAHRWGCVLLLDEADIFLSERTKDDFLRNSLVSVFLRILEYYAGILFLTTNRVGSFDEAFKSRIHISLYYPPLNEKSTIKIWKMNIDRTKSRKSDINIQEDKILAFARKHYETEEGRWNGRQIRNAFQTAIALAEYEAFEENEKNKHSAPLAKIILGKGHFKTVAKASLDFDKYLEDVYGNSRSKILHDQNIRDDEYGLRYSDKNPMKLVQRQGGYSHFSTIPKINRNRDKVTSRSSGKHSKSSDQRKHLRSEDRDEEYSDSDSDESQSENHSDSSDLDYTQLTSKSESEIEKKSKRKDKESSSRRNKGGKKK